jgi:hypothetical protein
MTTSSIDASRSFASTCPVPCVPRWLVVATQVFLVCMRAALVLGLCADTIAFACGDVAQPWLAL